MADLAGAQREPARFNYIVNSLLDPFCNPIETHATFVTDWEDPDESSAVWEYRTAIMIFINGLVSAPEDSRERWRVRREVEDRGLRRAMQVRNTVAI